MKLNLYAIRDNKGNKFSMIDAQDSDATAMRGFAYAVNSGNEIMSFSPADFDLYKIGEYDYQNGKITPLEIPEVLVNGASLVGVK